MVAPTNIRFPAALDQGLGDYAQRTGAKKSSVVITAVREWLRMQAHPGIVFRTTVTGQRRAALSAGPEIWTVADSWLQHDKPRRNAAVVADAVGLTTVEVEVALNYWAEYRDEIDDVIRLHHSSQNESLAAWERRRELDAI
jgi:hypothetical protein